MLSVRTCALSPARRLSTSDQAAEALAHAVAMEGERMDTAEIAQLSAAIAEQRAARGRLWQIDVDELELSAFIWPELGQ
jgi:hypothetical protein